MFSKPCSAFLVAIAVALAVGWWVAGPLVYKIAIGLNETAFPAGEQLQHLFTRLAPDFAWAGAGLVLLVITSLAVGTAAFLLVRAVKRSQVASIDPSRRRFLTGLGLGTATALVSTALVGGLGLAVGRRPRPGAWLARPGSRGARLATGLCPDLQQRCRGDAPRMERGVEGQSDSRSSPSGAHRVAGIGHRARYGDH